MRLILLVAACLATGCKTAEFAVDHQMTGLHLAAKFEAKAGDNRWNGGDQTSVIRR
jgi:hypothetical protein